MVGEMENQPTIRQLQQLASIGASSTKENASRRRNERNGEYYARNELYVDMPYDESDRVMPLKRAMNMRIGKLATGSCAFAGWRLDYFDVCFANRKPDEQTKVLTKYEFEWSAKQVLLARRSIALKAGHDTVQNSDLSDAILRFHVRDDVAALLEAQMDFEQMTHDDCDRLIDDTATYYAQLAAASGQAVE